MKGLNMPKINFTVIVTNKYSIHFQLNFIQVKKKRKFEYDCIIMINKMQ